jgi:hypothetical protein
LVVDSFGVEMLGGIFRVRAEKESGIRRFAAAKEE